MVLILPTKVLCFQTFPVFCFSIDEFMIECPCLGRLEKVRIGHDNSGFGPGWFLEQVSAG